MKKLKLIVLLLPIFFMASCTSETDIEALQKKLPFISLPNSTDFTDLSSIEINIINSVENRIQIVENGEGLYEIVAKSGEEINISENIYDYFNRLVHNTNQIALKYRNTKRNRLISRSETDGIALYDCVAYAVYGAGKVDSVETAKKRIGYAIANKGIPPGDMLKTLGLFGRVEQLNPRAFNQAETFDKPIIAVFRPDAGSNIGHAVNATRMQQNGHLKCTDYQNGRTEITIPLGEIYYIYRYLD
jgi:PBP1b-binding outer membrane lipoprotein LpoB